MENEVKKTFEQGSVTYSFHGDIKGKSILFGSGKNKNQKGQTKRVSIVNFCIGFVIVLQECECL